MNGVIVNLAPTGMVPTRQDSPHVPLTAEEIVADVVRCARAGASMVHLHARNDDGAPTTDRRAYERLVDGVRSAVPDLVVVVTTSGRNEPDVGRRADVLRLDGDLRPDMASLTLSSLNFARQASVNSPDTVRRLAETMRDNGIRPELEVFDTGMAEYACYLLDRGVLEPPLYCNLMLGNVATAQPRLATLTALVAALPPGTIWCAAGIGRAQWTSNAVGLLHGWGARTGLEDNLWLDDDRTTPATNADLVGRCVRLAGALGRPVMRPPEVRRLLALEDRRP